MFIIKWEKGKFQALGLHHASLACLSISLIAWVLWSLFHSIIITLSGSSIAYGFWIGYYFFKEKRENRNEFEMLDLLSPVIFGMITLIAIRLLII